MSKDIPDAAIAGKLSRDLAELVVINQVRLLRSPRLLEALERNPDLTVGQWRRLNELKETFKLGSEPPDE